MGDFADNGDSIPTSSGGQQVIKCCLQAVPFAERTSNICLIIVRWHMSYRFFLKVLVRNIFASFIFLYLNWSYPMQANQGQGDASGSAGATFAQQHFTQNKELQEQLKKFWAEMRDDVEKVGTDPAEFKSQQLPLARIKKVNENPLFNLYLLRHQPASLFNLFPIPSVCHPSPIFSLFPYLFSACRS